MPLRWPTLPSINTGARVRSSLAAVFAASLLFGCGEIKSATEYLISGNEAFKRNDYKQAELDYKNAIRLEPNSSTALNNLGVVLNELGKYDDAQATLSKAISVDPKNVIAHYTLAQVFIKRGNYPEAIAEAHKSIELSSNEMGGHKALAEASLRKGKQEKNNDDLKSAIDEYHFILQSDSDDDAAHQNLGEALAATGDKDAALVEEKKAVELNPDNLGARKALATLLHEKGDNQDAVDQLDTVIKKDASDTEARKLRTEINGGTH